MVSGKADKGLVERHTVEKGAMTEGEEGEESSRDECRGLGKLNEIQRAVGALAQTFARISKASDVTGAVAAYLNYSDATCADRNMEDRSLTSSRKSAKQNYSDDCDDKEDNGGCSASADEIYACTCCNYVSGEAAEKCLCSLSGERLAEAMKVLKSQGYDL